MSSLTSLLECPRSMQSAVRDSLALHPPQRREKRYAQEVHLRTDERPACRHAGARVVNSKQTRKEALKLLGGGLAATALGVGFSAQKAGALSQIKTGVFPYSLANPNLPTLVGGFREFTNGVNHKPFYFAAWTDFYKQQAGALYDWYEQDILAVTKTLGVHLFLSLEVKPKQPQYSYRELWRGAPTAAGIDSDQYVMNVAQHLKSWTDRTGHVVPVRMLHEFNCPPLSDGGYGGPYYMPRLWRRWATILRGGDVDGNLKAMGSPRFVALRAWDATTTCCWCGASWQPLQALRQKLTGGSTGQEGSGWISAALTCTPPQTTTEGGSLPCSTASTTSPGNTASRCAFLSSIGQHTKKSTGLLLLENFWSGW